MVGSSLRQGQVGPIQDGLRDKQQVRYLTVELIELIDWERSFLVPDGVIGNTWAFGAYIPGSSPGRVVASRWLVEADFVGELILDFFAVSPLRDALRRCP